MRCEREAGGRKETVAQAGMSRRPADRTELRYQGAAEEAEGLPPVFGQRYSFKRLPQIKARHLMEIRYRYRSTLKP